MTHIPYSSGNHVTYVERAVREMLIGFRVKFHHRAYVEGREVDFLIPRPGRPGLILEIDGDVYHMNQERKESKDRLLRNAGWEVIHFWGSEVLGTPSAVESAIELELEGVPVFPPPERWEKNARGSNPAGSHAHVSPG